MKKFYHLIGLVILGIILSRIDLKKVVIYFSQINLGLFISINLLILPTILIKAFRWRYILKMQGVNYSLKDSFISYLAGICAGIVTPGRVGETIKAVYLKKELGTPLTKGLVSVVLDRLVDFYVLLLLALWGAWNFLSSGNTRIILAVLFFCALVIPLYLLFNKRTLEWIGGKIYRTMIIKIDKGFFDGQVKEFLGDFKKIIMNYIYVPAALTFMAYAIFFLHNYLLARIVPIGISYTQVIFVISISSLISLVPITVLGLGTREASLIYLFSRMGFSAENAIVYSFLIFLSFYVISGLLAFLGWLSK